MRCQQFLAPRHVIFLPQSQTQLHGLAAGIHDTTGVIAALMSGGYDGLSRLVSCTSIDGTATYGYDAVGQLVSATYSSPNPESPAPSPESYTYDANGNLRR